MFEDDEELPIVYAPDEEPQATTLYIDARDPDKPVGYSSTPGGLSTKVFIRSDYPESASVLEAFKTCNDQFSWFDPTLYWTAKYWFFRVIKK